MPATELLTDKYVERWNGLLNFLEHWYGFVDRRALACVWSAVLWHYFRADPPVWLYVDRPPEYAWHPLDAVPDVLLVRDPHPALVPDLLARTGQDAIWLMPELDRVYARRPRAQRGVVEILRSVKAGRIEFLKGKPWSGRVTVLASAIGGNPVRSVTRTNRIWEPMRACFLKLRWRREPAAQEVEYARKRVGCERQVDDSLRERLLGLLDFNFRSRSAADLVHPLFEELSPLGHLVSLCQYGAGHFNAAEFVQSVIRLARAHATLLGKARTDREDLALARRLAIDAIPPTPLRILRLFAHGEHLTYRHVQEATRLRKPDISPLLKRLVDAGIMRLRGATVNGKTYWYYAFEEPYDQVLRGEL